MECTIFFSNIDFLWIWRNSFILLISGPILRWRDASRIPKFTRTLKCTPRYHLALGCLESTNEWKMISELESWNEFGTSFCSIDCRYKNCINASIALLCLLLFSICVILSPSYTYCSRQNKFPVWRFSDSMAQSTLQANNILWTACMRKPNATRKGNHLSKIPDQIRFSIIMFWIIMTY